MGWALVAWSHVCTHTHTPWCFLPQLPCPYTPSPSPSPQALALVYSFASSQPSLQALLTTLLCLSYAALHVGQAPMGSPPAQALQTCLLLCLGVLAVTSTPTADLLQAGGPVLGAALSPDLAPGPLLHALQSLCGLWVPGAAVAWAFLGPWALRAARWGLHAWGPRRAGSGLGA